MKYSSSKPKFYALIGVAGVAHDENKRAKRWGAIFEWPMILLAIWILFLWHFQNIGYVPELFVRLTDIAVWLFFIIELLLFTYLVDNKWHYIKTNWLNLVIIAFGVPIIWGEISYVGLLRTARLLVMLALLTSVFDSFREILSKNQLGLTLIVSLFFILIAGILVAGFDPAVENPWMGLWWAWVTVTTVGYGDVVPASAIGKILGALLILMGIGLFSMLTASFSAFFIRRGEKGIEIKEQVNISKIDKTYHLLEQINQRIDNLEKQLSIMNNKGDSQQ